MDKNIIYQGDTIEVMKTMPDKSFDFCFADPPYFLQLDKNKKLYRVEGSEFQGCDDEWDQFPSMEEYKKFTTQWIREVKRLLKDDATICIISGMQSIFEIGNILREQGFWIINDIIWEKTNPTPNFGGTRLNNSHETLIWASKRKKSKFTFNYKTGKFINNGKQLGSVWRFSVCTGNERIKDENGKKLHNTQKPEKLMDRIIKLFTKKNDLILDPFGGTMTTGVVAKKNGRNFVMIERDIKYIKFGQERINSTFPLIDDEANAIFDIKPLKVKFSDMVDDGYFWVGEEFIHKNGEKAILIDKSGKLKYNNTIDSMHQIAGYMNNQKHRINAFDCLNVIRNNKLTSIDSIRKKYREVKEINERRN